MVYLQESLLTSLTLLLLLVGKALEEVDLFSVSVTDSLSSLLLSLLHLIRLVWVDEADDVGELFSVSITECLLSLLLPLPLSVDLLVCVDDEVEAELVLDKAAAAAAEEEEEGNSSRTRVDLIGCCWC